MIGDVLLLLGSFVLWAMLRFGDLRIENPDYYQHYVTLFWWVLLLWFGLSFGLRINRLPVGVEIRKVIGRFGRMTFLLAAMLAVVVVSAKGYYYSRAFLALFLSTYLIGGALYRSLFVSQMRARYRRGVNVRQVALVGTGAVWDRLVAELTRHPEYGYRIACRADVLEDVQIAVDEYWVTPDMVADGLQVADETSRRLRVVPDLAFLGAHRTRIIPLGDVPIVELRPEPLAEGLSAALKRLVDLLGALLGLIFLMSWLMPLLAIIIRLDSRGPCLFGQIRHGTEGRSFTIWKFRTMRRDADDQVQATASDDRITRIGRFLRWSHLDELPQLWNVLIGDMSLVGPRPHMDSDHQAYADAIHAYGIRHWVKPGMTGLAQARGLTGEKDHETMTERIRADLYYVEKWSLLLDLKIIAATLIGAKRWV